MHEELAEIRALGYEINDGITGHQEFGVSAVVLDNAGTPVGCATVSAPRGRAKARRGKELVRSVHAWAERVSHRLGYTG